MLQVETTNAASVVSNITITRISTQKKRGRPPKIRDEIDQESDQNPRKRQDKTKINHFKEITKFYELLNFFPLKTSIDTIHKTLNIEKIEERTNSLFIKFLKSRSNHALIAEEINKFKKNKTAEALNRGLKRGIKPLETALEYSSVWSPHDKTDIKIPERVQSKATKLVTSLRFLTYAEILEKINSTTL
ncbi:hypothetical protein BpHYR1_053393 [Brachionus plicatilis]|uniref:RNA-directed DNA polymerase from mobile element jockey-like n=1 Tax=Brachionus plicatilis TaxID=10195 RepID=A0A3M7QXS1_BRAPC|nr:hypothetical protein BpHYR1_053393 [Brachionus plicatilis]